MTLRMVDGPVANLPPGFDAYAGYTNKSGIGLTYPAVVELCKQRNAIPFSITTNGSPAQCADVESGAMTSWTGYDYGYCSVGNVNSFITLYGRPRKLWTAHYSTTLGAHICSPKCWPGLLTTADGTQWTNHGTADYDESLLSDTFFDLDPPTTQQKDTPMEYYQDGGQDHIIVYQPSRNRTVHYWQATPGTPEAKTDPQWRSEVLPEPA